MHLKVSLSTPAPQGRQKEQIVQDFLEDNPELIPTPNRLNHQLHFGVIISKFPLGTELTTDYVYISKSSDTWRITLVEIESPDKRIFTAEMRKVITTAEFNAALHQVKSWKRFIEDNKQEVIRRLEPLIQPAHMRSNPVEFHYQLLIGRSEEKNVSADRKKFIRMLIQDDKIDILTYDTLLTWYKNDRRYKKNILQLSGSLYKFKKMHILPEHIFAYVGPDKFVLSDEERKKLMDDGYEIDKWEKGELLICNTKYTSSTHIAAMKQGTMLN